MRPADYVQLAVPILFIIFRQVVVVFTIFTVWGRCRDKWEMELERLDLQSGEFNLSFNHYSLDYAIGPDLNFKLINVCCFKI